MTSKTQYNNRYRKLIAKSVDSQWLSIGYMDGLTASEWVNRARWLNIELATTPTTATTLDETHLIVDMNGEKNALVLPETILQAGANDIHKTSTPTADNFSTPSEI